LLLLRPRPAKRIRPRKRLPIATLLLQAKTKVNRRLMKVCRLVPRMNRKSRRWRIKRKLLQMKSRRRKRRQK